MKERNKPTSKEAGYMSNDYLALTDLTVQELSLNLYY